MVTVRVNVMVRDCFIVMVNGLVMVNGYFMVMVLFDGYGYG